MNLSKAFDTISYELLAPKFHAYWFSIEEIGVLLSYIQGSIYAGKST